MKSDPKLVVVDAHSLLWYWSRRSNLSTTARGTFDKIHAGELIALLPTIVLAENLHASDKRKFPVSFDEILSRIQSSKNFRIVDMNLLVIEYMRGLQGLELHDRIIAATALVYDARLMTKDGPIRSSGLVECIW